MTKLRKIASCSVLVLGFFVLTGERGCEDESTRLERANVERQDKQYAIAQPAPAFDWSLERHLLTELYQARNKAVATYSYVRNQYTGKVLSSCPSIGFPIPANTQLTNPHKQVYPGYHDTAVIEQAEPNGLYSSPSTKGTYVMCVNKDGKVTPRYYEEDVEAYVTPMVEKDGTPVEVEGAKPSIVIDPKRPGQ